MHKGLLAWNIILTVLLVTAFLVQGSYINLINERIVVLNENLMEMSKAMNEQAEFINAHAKVINQHADLINEEYLAAIKANQESINETVKLISEYREVINQNSSNFEEILENLKNLSIFLAQ